jgi:hypothetical protein
MSEYQAPVSQGKPGKVQAIAIMTLIDGILNALMAISWAVIILTGAIASLGVALLCCPIAIYPAVVAVFEIIYATKIMPEPPKTNEFPKYLAILQIINIVCGGILSIVTGILALVFANDPEVMGYFASVEPQQPTAY